MWEQQNFYLIRGLRMYGYDAEADELKRLSLGVVRKYYEKWGTVFEFYDALDTTDPTQVEHLVKRVNPPSTMNYWRADSAKTAHQGRRGVHPRGAGAGGALRCWWHPGIQLLRGAGAPVATRR